MMDDDDFNAPNPFRSGSGSGGGGGNTGDLLGADMTQQQQQMQPPPPPQQQFQQQQQPPPLQHQQYPPPQQQQQQQYPPQQMQQPQQQMYPPQQQQQQQQQQFQQPDPNSGMVGSFQPPPQTPPNQQMNPASYLSGPMDQNVNRTPQQSGAGGYQSQGSGELASTPFGWWNRCTSCFRIEGYLPYFDVDTTQVVDRITASLWRFPQPDYFRTAVIGDDSPTPGMDNSNNNSASDGRKGPDLYGPFWITMTLIFLIAATTNMSAYMHHEQKVRHSHSTSSTTPTSSSTTTDLDSNSTMVPDATQIVVEDVEEFEYDIHHLLRAGTALALMAWAIPTMFWLACNCLGMPNISWAMWICIYGYSMTPYLVACLVAWIPIMIVEWVVLAVATAASVLLILRNLSTPLLQQDGMQQAKAAPILMSILGVHVVFLLVLKFAFYHG